MSDLKAIANELNAVLDKHGVSSWALIFQDPDSFDVFSSWEGNAAVIHFETAGMASRILTKHHGGPNAVS